MELERTNSTNQTECLLKTELVAGYIGKIQEPIKTGLVLWAHRPPGRGFEISIGISEYLAKQKPIIVIDDLLPVVVFNRTEQEQKQANDRYSDFFETRGCNIVFLRDLYFKIFGNNFSRTFVEFSDKLSLNAFLQLLPEKKKTCSANLSLVEVIHALNNLLALEIASKELGLNTIITPSFNQAIFIMHRNISDKPMAAIVTPAFGDEVEIDKKLTILSTLISTKI